MSGFAGLRVLALESRRAPELAKLISAYGGEPIVAPAMREVPLDEADASKGELRLRGARVAVQEYGVSNPELLSGLRERGAAVTPVPVYHWALPDDCAPIRAAVKSIADGEIDAVLFTTSVQVAHLLQIAAEMK